MGIFSNLEYWGNISTSVGNKIPTMAKATAIATSKKPAEKSKAAPTKKAGSPDELKKQLKAIRPAVGTEHGKRVALTLLIDLATASSGAAKSEKAEDKEDTGKMPV